MAKARAPMIEVPRRIAPADLTAIGEVVTKSIRTEFVRIGLATESERDQISAQKDFAFLRDLRHATESARGVIRTRLLTGALGFVLLLVGIGAGVVFSGGAAKSSTQKIESK